MRRRVPDRVPGRVPMVLPARGSAAAAQLAMTRNAVAPVALSPIKVSVIKVSAIKVSVIKVSVDPGPVYRAWMGRPRQGRRTTVPHTKVHPMARAASACSDACIACT